MAIDKELKTTHALYNNIVRAITPDLVTPKFVALKGGEDTITQPWAYGLPEAVPGATWNCQQGIARTDTEWFAINTASIRKFGLNNGAPTATNNSPYIGLPSGVDHLGDGCVIGEFLYIAYSNYNLGSSTQMGLAKYNITDLSLDSFIDLKAHTNLNASACSLSKSGTEILVTSFFGTAGSDQRNTDIYRIDLELETFLGTIQLVTPCVGIQSISYHAGIDSYVIGSHDAPNLIEKIYLYDAAALTLHSAIDPVGTLDEIEGVEVWDNVLYFHTLNGSPQILPLDITLIGRVAAKGDPVPLIDVVTLPETGTLTMWVTPLALYNYGSLFDTLSYTNDWKSWVYADGRLAWRFKATDTIITATGTIVANQKYFMTFTWEKVGGNFNSKLGLNGTFIGSDTGVWVNKPAAGLALGGINAGNSQADYSYGDVTIYDKVLSAAEILDLNDNPGAMYVSNAAPQESGVPKIVTPLLVSIVSTIVTTIVRG